MGKGSSTISIGSITCFANTNGSVRTKKRMKSNNVQHKHHAYTSYRDLENTFQLAFSTFLVSKDYLLNNNIQF